MGWSGTYGSMGHFRVWTDSEWVGDTASRRSRSGGWIEFEGIPIQHRSVLRGGRTQRTCENHLGGCRGGRIVPSVRAKGWCSGQGLRDLLSKREAALGIRSHRTVRDWGTTGWKGTQPGRGPLDPQRVRGHLKAWVEADGLPLGYDVRRLGRAGPEKGSHSVVHSRAQYVAHDRAPIV